MNVYSNVVTGQQITLPREMEEKMRQGHITLDHLKWFTGLSKYRRDALAVGKKSAPKLKDPLLELVSTVVIPATSGQFVAKEKFVIDTKHNAPVKISHLGGNFKAWFLSGDGKIENLISEQTLRYHKLRRLSADGPIIAELGGETKAETTLSEMFSFMEKQKHGENGVLLNNIWTNIFYIKDNASVLRAVSVYWHGDGWDVGAGSVRSLNRWFDGRQVFSRNSVLESSDTSAPAQT